MEDMELVANKSPLTANDYADWFINVTDRQSGGLITSHMVQKMVFFAQAWYLANKGRPLFEDDFVAWSRGPTILSLYARFENFRHVAIPEMDRVRVIKGDKLQLVEGIQERYGCYSAAKLEELAKEEGGPWHEARRGVSPEAECNAIVLKSSMQKYYANKLESARS